MCVILAMMAGMSCAREKTPAAEVSPFFEHVAVDGKPPASYRINDIQIGDVDGDGRADIWTSGRGGGDKAYQMVWYRNPTWQRHAIAKGDFKYGALGDVDGDGDLDVVVGQSWFENTGRPKDRDWPRHGLGYTAEPDLVLLGEVNGDGRLDVVFTTKRELWWLPGPVDPKGRWERYRIFSSQNNKRTGGTLADIDGDGRVDVVYGNAWFANPKDPKKMPWRMAVIDPRWPAEARSAAGDINGDGRMDVVLSDEEGDKGVTWYESRQGRWVRHVVTGTYRGVHSLAVVDFDRDGDLDIFAAEMHTTKRRRVAVFEQVDGGWIEHVLSFGGSHNAKVGDVDGDGWADVVGKNFQASSGRPLQVDLWVSRRGRILPVDRWRRHVIDRAGDKRAVFVTGADMDGDGRADVVTGRFWYQNPGRFEGPWRRRVIGNGVENMAVVYDFDDDGDMDVFGNTGKRFVWAENDGRGRFAVRETVSAVRSGGAGDFLQGAAAGRILAGGGVQVVVSWHRGAAEGTQMFAVAGPDTVQWSWSRISSTTNEEQIALGDVDADGDTDIHLGTTWLEQGPKGTWVTHPAVTLGAGDPDRVTMADVDADGDWDVVIGCEHANRLVWGENPGGRDGVWTEHVIETGFLLMSVDVGDMDGDGDVDVVAGEHKGHGRAFVFENVGGGRRWRRHVVDGGDLKGLDHHDGTQLVDFDNDGDLDMVSIGWTSGVVVVYENLARRIGR